MPGKSIAVVVSVPLLALVGGCTIGDARDFVELEGPGFSEQEFDVGNRQREPAGPSGLSQDDANELSESQAQSLQSTGAYEFIQCPASFNVNAAVEAEGDWAWGFDVYATLVNTVKANELEGGGWSLACLASGSRLEVFFDAGDSTPGQREVAVDEVGVRQDVQFGTCFEVPAALGFLCFGDPDGVFANDVLPILGDDDCRSCHFLEPPSNVVSFYGTPAEVYQRLDERGLIDVSNPAASSLLTAPTGAQQNSHPALWPIGSADYQTVLAWIESGAPAP